MNNKWRTPYNSKEFPKNYEVNTQPSQTIPDQTMSVREIMDRYARGLPISAGKVPIYDGDEDLPDFKKMDLSEQQELLRANAEHIERLQSDLSRPKESAKHTQPPTTEESDSPAPSAGQ
ncbi:hypothetical protein [Tortoise microvirus 32]|nr:hypothetical protein [Tortoise microvirus 32]